MKRAGFTLAEVAVTLVIVSIGLVLVLQGLSTTKLSAAETHYRKVARELAQLTLAEVESGLLWEDIGKADRSGKALTGTYADEGYEAFHYELVLGDEEFRQREPSAGAEGAFHDSWAYERGREERRAEREDEEVESEEPFEKVRVKVLYPSFGERESSLVLERWIPWELVYEQDEDEDAPAPEPEG